MVLDVQTKGEMIMLQSGGLRFDVVEVEKKVLLKEATRDELIDELRNRKSVTFTAVPNGEAVTIESSNGRISLDGETWIFAIPPNNQILGGNIFDLINEAFELSK